MYGYVRPLTPDEIYHHGILGQKWGKRNGPPYPLGVNDHSAVEKKSGWHKSLDGKNPKEYNRNNESKKSNIVSIKSSGKTSSEHKGLTDKQKRAIKIGAVAVGTALAVYGGYKLSKSDVFKDFTTDIKRSWIEGVTEGMNKHIDSYRISADFLGYKELSQKTGLKFNENFKFDKEVLKKYVENINPNNSELNCGSCAVATMLNTLGFEVQAVDKFSNLTTIQPIKGYAKKEGGFPPIAILRAFKGARFESLNGDFNSKVDSFEKIISKLESYGEGATGIIQAFYEPVKYGHYTTWKIVNGKCHLLEGQVSEVFSGKEMYDNFFEFLKPETIRWSRLDGLEMVPEFISELVKNRE